jgi:hypothetical protein
MNGNALLRISLLCFACVGIGTACSKPARKAKAGTPAYQIVSDKSVNAGQLREVWVRIAEPISESAVRKVAQHVKSKGATKAPKTSVSFLLPSMEVGKGAWARAVFRPELDVKIIGPTVAEYKAAMATRNQPVGQVVGKWLWPLPGGLTRTITIIEQKNGEIVVAYAMDGSEGYVDELVEVEPRRKYQKQRARFGEFQVIADDGRLELWDENGLIETLARAPQ